MHQGILRIKDILALMGTKIDCYYYAIQYTYGKKLDIRVFPTCQSALETIAAADS